MCPRKPFSRWVIAIVGILSMTEPTGAGTELSLERQDGGTWTAPVTTSTFSMQRGSAGSPSASSLTSSNNFWIRNF